MNLELKNMNIELKHIARRTIIILKVKLVAKMYIELKHINLELKHITCMLLKVNSCSQNIYRI